MKEWLKRLWEFFALGLPFNPPEPPPPAEPEEEPAPWSCTKAEWDLVQKMAYKRGYEAAVAKIKESALVKHHGEE